MNEDYLAHYGVLGQKHGVRQYQYKDGSLTPLGRVHYGIGNGKHRSKTTQKNSVGLKEQTSQTRKVSDMTDDELISAISRKRLENQYNELFTVQTEKKVSWGKKFTNNLKDKAAIGLSQAVVNVGTKWVEKKLGSVLDVKVEEKKKDDKK